MNDIVSAWARISELEQALDTAAKTITDQNLTINRLKAEIEVWAVRFDKAQHADNAPHKAIGTFRWR